MAEALAFLGGLATGLGVGGLAGYLVGSIAGADKCESGLLESAVKSGAAERVIVDNNGKPKIVYRWLKPESPAESHEESQ